MTAAALLKKAIHLLACIAFNMADVRDFIIVDP